VGRKKKRRSKKKIRYYNKRNSAGHFTFAC